jgi:predicted LPLAT superfamily acyltransferase
VAEKPVCDAAGACVAIPVYNHAGTVGDVVRKALAFSSTVLVCDDGSTDGSGAAAREAGADVFALPTNAGKGVALRRLFSEASARGFRYVVCLDADGQHDPADLPGVVEALAPSPGALICGARDLVAAGAPGSSRFGRRFSNFWVWAESGLRVEDSQCGFRAYPLPETLQLASRRPRYDAEVELLLRAAWAGLPVCSVPVSVRYPPDRITHFRPFADNARISLLNTWTCLRLLLPWPLAPRLRPLPHAMGLSLWALRRWVWLGGSGPVRRACAAVLGLSQLFTVPWFVGVGMAALLGVGAVPAALSALAAWGLGRLGAPLAVAGLAPVVAAGLFGAWERRPRAAERAWTGRSRGGVLGHLFFLAVIRLIGRWGAYAALYPVALYFVAAMPRARRFSAAYLDLALSPAHGWARLVRSYKHFLCFAQTLVDRSVVGLRGWRAFQTRSTGLENLRNAARSGKGAVLLTAHVGGWELAGALLQEEVVADIAVVAFQGEQEQVARVLERMKGKQPRVIAVGEGQMLASLEVVRALRGGALVAMQGDRALAGSTVQLPFLGKPAPWPTGPFLLAAMSGVPLIATFCVKTGPTSYAFSAEPPGQFKLERGRTRDEQVREWMAPYVARVEALVRQYPMQWFNFYDFWSA